MEEGGGVGGRGRGRRGGEGEEGEGGGEWVLSGEMGRMEKELFGREARTREGEIPRGVWGGEGEGEEEGGGEGEEEEGEMCREEMERTGVGFLLGEIGRIEND